MVILQRLGKWTIHTFRRLNLFVSNTMGYMLDMTYFYLTCDNTNVYLKKEIKSHLENYESIIDIAPRLKIDGYWRLLIKRRGVSLKLIITVSDDRYIADILIHGELERTLADVFDGIRSRDQYKNIDIKLDIRRYTTARNVNNYHAVFTGIVFATYQPYSSIQHCDIVTYQ